jgi:hypothetical protein
MAAAVMTVPAPVPVMMMGGTIIRPAIPMIFTIGGKMAQFSILTGLTWLEGRADVYVVGDGAVQGPFTVTNGEVVLDHPVTRGFVGLCYQGKIKTLPSHRGADGAIVRHRARKLDRVMVEFSGFGDEVRVLSDYDNEAAPIGASAVLPSRRASDLMGSHPPARYQSYAPDIFGEFGETAEGHIMVTSCQGLPFQLHGIEFVVQANG